MGKLFSFLPQILAAVLGSVQFVEAIATNHDSLTKKQMAKASLIQATNTASIFLDPDQQKLASVLSMVIDHSIDLTVAAANAVGDFTHKDSPSASIPVVAAGSIMASAVAAATTAEATKASVATSAFAGPLAAE